VPHTPLRWWRRYSCAERCTAARKPAVVACVFPAPEARCAHRQQNSCCVYARRRLLQEQLPAAAQEQRLAHHRIASVRRSCKADVTHASTRRTARNSDEHAAALLPAAAAAAAAVRGSRDAAAQTAAGCLHVPVRRCASRQSRRPCSITTIRVTATASARLSRPQHDEAAADAVAVGHRKLWGQRRCQHAAVSARTQRLVAASAAGPRARAAVDSAACWQRATASAQCAVGAISPAAALGPTRLLVRPPQRRLGTGAAQLLSRAAWQASTPAGLACSCYARLRAKQLLPGALLHALRRCRGRKEERGGVWGAGGEDEREDHRTHVQPTPTCASCMRPHPLLHPR
jgi:hypothetical protein